MSKRSFALILLVLHAAAALAVAEINYYLSPLAIRISAEAVLVIFPALYLPPVFGFFIVVAIGLLNEGQWPGPPGLYMLLLAGLWCLATWIRRYSTLPDPQSHILIAWILQVVATLLLLGAHFRSGFDLLDGIRRASIDLAFSCLWIALIVPTWCSFLNLLLEMVSPFEKLREDGS